MSFCERVSPRTRNKMKELWFNTLNSGREHGMKLCGNSRVYSSEHCIGEECKIPAEILDVLSCPGGTFEEGFFHTHPNANLNISEGDYKYASISGFKQACIGTNGLFAYCYNINDTARHYGEKFMEVSNEKEKIINSVSDKGYVNREELSMDTWEKLRKLEMLEDKYLEIISRQWINKDVYDCRVEL